MANLEDEMSRFEQEIMGSGATAPHKAPSGGSAQVNSLVIGANTFTSVQEQLSALRAQVYGSSTNASAQPPQGTNFSGPNSSGLGAGKLAGPPLPPGFRPPMNGQSDTMRPLSGPPRPPNMAGPASSPFLPPQLKLRGPPPPPGMSRPAGPATFPGPGNQQPPMQRPPSVSQMHRMPQSVGNQSSSFSSKPVSYSSPPVLSAPKVVYSSKPVMNKPGQDPKPELTSTVDRISKKREATDSLYESSAGGSSAASSVEASTSAASLSDSHQLPTTAKKEKKGKAPKEKKIIRTAANEVWEDTSLLEWDPNDFRIFCGDLGNEVTEEKLAEAFKKYPSLQKTKVIRDRRTHKTKGFGFISFKDPADYTRAMREMNGKYVGNRPIKLRKSTWKDRNIEVVKKKDKEKKRLGFR